MHSTDIQSDTYQSCARSLLNARDTCLDWLINTWIDTYMHAYILTNLHTNKNTHAYYRHANLLSAKRVEVALSRYTTYMITPSTQSKKFPEFDMLFLSWNSQSFHIHTGGVSSFTTENISWTGSFRMFIVHGRRTAPDRVRKKSEFGRK